MTKKDFLFRSQYGVTLIELTISIAIIAICLFGILSVFKVSATHSADPVTKKQAILISETLLEEITSKSFTKSSDGYSGPFDSQNRHKFDAVIDYNNLEISGITTASGMAIPNLNNYSAKINIENKSLGTVPASDSLLITITIQGPNDNFILKGYKINDE